MFVGIFQWVYSQEIKTINPTNSINANYVFANIYWNDILQKELSSSLINIVKQGDPKKTPYNYFEGSDEVLVNIIISLSESGEYSKSKLFVIPLLNNPKIDQIREDVKNKKIYITIEHRDSKSNKLIQIYCIDSTF